MMRRIATQLAELILGRRPGRAAGDSDLGHVDPADLQGGFSLRWGVSPEADQPGGNRSGGNRSGLSWSFHAAPVASRIFKIDEAQLQAAREAHEAGDSWEQISRRVNPEYDSLSPLEQDFYRRALQMAVEEEPRSS
jgi:hypothetical protein